MRIRLKSTVGIHEFQTKRETDQLEVVFGDKTLLMKVFKQSPVEFLINLDGQNLKAFGVRKKDNIFLQICDRTWIFTDVSGDDISDEISGGEADLHLFSPMPGSVIKTLVVEGEAVKKHQALIIVEAMKMENEVKAPADAVVDKILVEAGQQVGANELLVELKPPESPDGEKE